MENFSTEEQLQFNFLQYRQNSAVHMQQLCIKAQQTVVDSNVVFVK